MSDQKIQPNELRVMEYGAIIRTRCPKELITDAMIQQRAAAVNLDCGDFLRVQCTNHERDTVLHFAEWMVYSRKSRINVAELSDQVTRTSEVYSHALLRTVSWTATPAASDAERTVTWNPGRKVHEVKEGGRVIGSSADKETAQKMADGTAPLAMEMEAA